MPRKRENIEEDPKGGFALLEKTKVSKPRMYAVIMHNDDYTPMDFVVAVLQKYFQKEYHEAHKLMYKVHTEGAALIGIYPKEIAETRIYLVHQEARQHQYPLRCSMEPEDINAE